MTGSNENEEKDKSLFRRKETWWIVVCILLSLLVICVRAYVKYSFDEKMLKEQIFDMKLWLFSTVLSVPVNGMIIGLNLTIAAVVMVYLVMILFAMTKKRSELFFDILARGYLFISTVKGKAAIVAGLLVISLIFPHEDIREYRVKERRVFPIMAIYYQLQDLWEEPVELELTGMQVECYQYTHRSRSRYNRSSSTNSVYYTNYEWDGEKYLIPTTPYFYNQLSKAELLEGESVKVLVYPNTGMVVDFVEKPMGLLESDAKRLIACRDKYGYPYLLSTDEMGWIEVSQNPEVPQVYFEHYSKLFDYEAFWVSYNGNEPYREYLSSARNKDFVTMENDGTYEIRIGKENGMPLSDQLIFVVKNGYVESINGVPVEIQAFDPVRPASATEEYSEEMARFLSIAESLEYRIDLESYHYIFERKGRLFYYKYANAFLGSIQSSIQVYECETEEDAVLTYESWTETYGTEPMEVDGEKMYALRSNSSAVDNGILLRKGNFVYIFWDENMKDAKEMAGVFGCMEAED